MKTFRSLPAIAVLAVAFAAGCSKAPEKQTDASLAADVQGKIAADSSLQGRQIAINVKDGVVTLSGQVQSESERLLAATDASGVEGVRTVINNLQAAANADQATNQPPAPEAAAPRRATTTRSVPGKSRIPAGSSLPANVQNQVGPNNPAGTQDYSQRATEVKPPAIVNVTVPAGTSFTIRTTDTIDTEQAQPGGVFTASLDGPIYIDDKIAVPSHADVRGRIVDVKSAGKFEGRSELTLELTSLAYNGHSYRIVTNKWNRLGASRGKNTAAKVGGGAAVGAIIGAIAGGGKGAAIGAGVGAGVGGGAQAVTKGQQIVLKPETLLSFTLEDPITVTPSDNTNRTGQRIDAENNNQ